jgi:hypothetical protein
MIPRSASGGQEVNNRKADEVFAEHDPLRLFNELKEISGHQGTEPA